MAYLNWLTCVTLESNVRQPKTGTAAATVAERELRAYTTPSLFTLSLPFCYNFAS